MSPTLFLLPTELDKVPTRLRLTIRALETDNGDNFTFSSRISNLDLYIICFSVAGAIFLFVALWIAIRRRVHAMKRNGRNSPSVSVRGGHEEKCSVNDEKKPSPEDFVPIKGPALSRTYMASTIVLPQRALISPEGITKYNGASGRFSRPFGPSSANPHTSDSPTPSNHRISAVPPSQRSSYASTTDGDAAVLSEFPPPPFKRFSGLSALSAKALMSPQQQGQLVRQIFTPVLPDELRLTRLGERLTVVKSFDDGWCVVSRAKYCPSYHRNAESACTPVPDAKSVELGAVPAWCFMKPVNGLHSERPIRRSSLGITMDVDVGLDRGDWRKALAG